MKKEVVLSRTASEDFSALLGLLLESDRPLVIPCFRLPESLTRFSIRVEGPGYDECTPGEQMRTLWEIQEDFFRVAALLVHDTTDVRALSEEERKAFELGFETCDGGWSVRVVADGFWRTLLEKTEERTEADMVALLVMGSFCVWSATAACDAKNSREVQDREGVSGIPDEINEQCPYAEAIRYRALVASLSPQERKRYEDALESTIRAKRSVAEKLATRSPDATRIKVGGAEYQGAALEALRARSKNATEPFDVVSGRFQIVGLNLTKGAPEWSMQLREADWCNEVTVSASEDTLEVDLAEAQETILDAFCSDRDVEATYLVGKRKTFLLSIRPAEGEVTEH